MVDDMEDGGCRHGDGGRGEKLGFLFGRWEGDDEVATFHWFCLE